MNNTRPRKRGRGELLVELAERRREFLTYSQEKQQAIDNERLMPVLEMHETLERYFRAENL